VTIKFSRETTILFCATSVAIVIPIAVFILVKFPFKQTPDERSLSIFSPVSIAFSSKMWQDTSATCPVTESHLSLDKQVASTSLEISLPKSTESDQVRLPLLTFILYEGNVKKDTAILDGHLLRKGNSLNGWQVIRIEQKRVQLTGRKGTQWLSME